MKISKVIKHENSCGETPEIINWLMRKEVEAYQRRPGKHQNTSPNKSEAWEEDGWLDRMDFSLQRSSRICCWSKLWSINMKDHLVIWQPPVEDHRLLLWTVCVSTWTWPRWNQLTIAVWIYMCTHLKKKKKNFLQYLIVKCLKFKGCLGRIQSA